MCEGFHLALNQAVSLKHPSLFRLIGTIKEFESSSERALAQLALGAQPKRRKNNYVLVGEALNRLANNTFGNGRVPSVQQVLDYVDAVAFQLWEVNQ